MAGWVLLEHTFCLFPNVLEGNLRALGAIKEPSEDVAVKVDAIVTLKNPTVR